MERGYSRTRSRREGGPFPVDFATQGSPEHPEILQTYFMPTRCRPRRTLAALPARSLGGTSSTSPPEWK